MEPTKNKSTKPMFDIRRISRLSSFSLIWSLNLLIAFSCIDKDKTIYTAYDYLVKGIDYALTEDDKKIK